MNFNFLRRVSRIAAIGVILFGSASCIAVNEKLGEDFIPTNHKWHVYSPKAAELKEIRLQMADSLSAYSNTRFTFGTVTSPDPLVGTTIKSTSFTLVPMSDTLDFGKNPRVNYFHFRAKRDTLSTVYDNQIGMIQNIYVSELKEALDSTIIYSGAFQNAGKTAENRAKFLNTDKLITAGIPVYDGGDSLSFYFSQEYAEQVVERLNGMVLDSISDYLKKMPGIYITTDAPVGPGGRINMFTLPVETDSYGYISGNYAYLKLTSDYGDRKDVDTAFVFYFGPSRFLTDEDQNFPEQYAFNGSEHSTYETYQKDGVAATDRIIVEGGSGIKPVVKAREIRRILDEQIAAAGIDDPNEVVINKATITLPYNVNGDYSLLDKYPDVLSPTVRLRSSEGDYVSYAGLTDSSIESENQGNINRSTSVYSPDISHHVQEILKLDKNASDYEKNIEKYDIWFLIMHEEIVEESSSGSSYEEDYYNNLLYNSYYNNMMYDPYGYGYGGYGYGYGDYGYGYSGYNNYYNYMMMSMYSSGYYDTSDTTSSTMELDRDRYYSCNLTGPDAASGDKPTLKLTFSVPYTAE